MSRFFQPIPGDFREWCAEDLTALRDVSEAWHVEYKREAVSARAIAKSVSAFANHFGGWLFFGIEESDDGENKAGAFPGIDDTEIPRLQERNRDAIARLIDPTPHYEVSIIRGAEVSELAVGRSVLVVRVPRGAHPPYVHASGKVYRRAGDRSDPVAETSRAVLDMLWERGRERRRDLSDFLERDAERSKAEADSPYIILFLMPDPLGDRGRASSLTFEKFVGSCGSEGLPFDNFFSAGTSFVARQVGTNPAYLSTLSLRHYFDGTTVASIPLRTAPISSWNQEEIRVHDYHHIEAFQWQCEAVGLENSRWIDLNLLWVSLSYMLAEHEALLTAGGLTGPSYWKLRVDNAWRRVPFIDAQCFIDRIKRLGVPVVQANQLFTHGGTEPESMPPIEVGEIVRGAQDSEAGEMDFVQQAHVAGEPMWAAVLSLLGLEGLVDGKEALIEIMEASQRGAEAHRGFGGDPHGLDGTR